MGGVRKIKQLILGILNRIDVHLPLWAGVRVRNRWLFRPVLDYVEFHLADHCNLNCAGCTHYSPDLPPRFADLEAVRRDFARLAELFANVRHVRIMGGEPLLHPEVVRCLGIVRDALPRSRVTVATNGLLLAKQPADFWEACRRNRIGVDLTLYPPMAGREDEVRALCRRERVALRVTPNGAFLAKLDPAGRQPPKAAFRACRRGAFCPFLRDGRIYPCAESCLAGAYNAACGAKLTAEPGFDLSTHTAREILTYLMCPVFSCRHCSPDHRVFAWHNAGTKPEDWHA